MEVKYMHQLLCMTLIGAYCIIVFICRPILHGWCACRSDVPEADPVGSEWEPHRHAARRAAHHALPRPAGPGPQPSSLPSRQRESSSPTSGRPHLVLSSVYSLLLNSISRLTTKVLSVHCSYLTITLILSFTFVMKVGDHL